MRVIDRHIPVVCGGHRLPPRAGRGALASASSEVARDHPKLQQSHRLEPAPVVHDHPGLSASRPTARQSHDTQDLDAAVITQRQQVSVALQSDQADVSQGSRSTDSRAGVPANNYLAWWDRFTRHCVLASTALLAVSFTPLVASSASAAGVVLQSPTAWTVRAPITSRDPTAVWRERRPLFARLRCDVALRAV